MTSFERKPSNARSARAAKRKQPKLIENPKTTLVLRGHKTSSLVNLVLTDIFTVQKPNAVHFRKKNTVLPFEDDTPLNFFAQKNDCSLLVLGSHTKKRPNNLVFGRFFDGQVLELVEFGVQNFKSISEFKLKMPLGFRPCILFCGEDFEHDDSLSRVKNLFLDLFGGHQFDEVNLRGVENVMIFTAYQGVVYMRTYRIFLKKSGVKLPKVELVEVGPSLDLKLRRTQWAPADFWKEACKQPKALRKRKQKNISTTSFAQHGRVHKERQDLGDLQTRKMKGLKKSSSAPSASSEMGNKRQRKKQRTKGSN